MRLVFIVGIGLSLAATTWVRADTVAIGQLTLSYDNGNQDISFYNFTGVDQGCQFNGAQYSVCNAISVSNATLTVTAINENPQSVDPTASYNNALPSTLTFTSGADTIGPYDGLNPYIGSAAGTWQIPLNFGNPDEPACAPCDYQITQVTFSGSISSLDLPLRLGNSATYNGSDPSTYSVFNAQQTFSITWNVPATDYSNLLNPAYLYDSADVLVSDQAPPPPPPPPPTMPESPAGGLLSTGLFVMAATWHNYRRRRHS